MQENTDAYSRRRAWGAGGAGPRQHVPPAIFFSNVTRKAHFPSFYVIFHLSGIHKISDLRSPQADLVTTDVEGR